MSNEVFRYRFDEAKGSMVGEVGGDGEWTLYSILERVRVDNKKLQEENKRLREALEVYADEYKWSESQRYWFDVNDCFKLHGYKIAQEALKGE